MKNPCFLLFLLFVTFSCKPPSLDNKIVGVKIYNHEGDFGLLIEEWNSIGINTAFVSKELLANNEFRNSARNERIKTFVVLPIFFDEKLDEHSEFHAINSDGKIASDEWVKFACPSNPEYRNIKINSIVKLVEELDPDGISIDFIRHFVFWEKVYPDTPATELPNTCFCDLCIKHFCQLNDISYPDFLTETSDKASMIMNGFSTQWTDWKCRLITTMIDQIVTEVKKVKPDIIVNTHIVPWKNSDFEEGIQRIAGQDLKAISPLTNYLSPMTYAHMVKQNASWVHEVVVDFHAQTGTSILPSIQVKEAYLSDSISSQEFEENLKSALLAPSSGVIFWSWEHLQQDPWKKEIIKTQVN